MRLTIHASKVYDIVSYDRFDNLNKEMKAVTGKKVLIVTDDNVAPLYLGEVKASLNNFETHEIILPHGEKSKSVENYLAIISYLADAGFSRSDCVLALGGGVVGDIAGFASATYMRGISFVQCPTSFLAMIDSSVGGKTAVDLPQGKNLLGAFHQPDLVYIALSTLRSLPEREVICGMGEAVKYAFLSTSVTKRLLEKGMTEDLVFRCLKIKAEVVEGDEFDTGRRAILNLGHTIGHAIEQLSSFTLSHGECVAKGIAQIIKMSAVRFGLSREEVQEMEQLVGLSGADLDPVYPLSDILAQTAHDKKKENTGVRFVLIKKIGETERVLLTPAQARELLI